MYCHIFYEYSVEFHHNYPKKEKIKNNLQKTARHLNLWYNCRQNKKSGANGKVPIGIIKFPYTGSAKINEANVVFGWYL